MRLHFSSAYNLARISDFLAEIADLFAYFVTCKAAVSKKVIICAELRLHWLNERAKMLYKSNKESLYLLLDLQCLRLADHTNKLLSITRRK